MVPPTLKHWEMCLNTTEVMLYYHVYAKHKRCFEEGEKKATLQGIWTKILHSTSRCVSGDLTHLDVAFLAKAILATFTEECYGKNKKHTKTNYRLYQHCKSFPIYDSNKDTELVQVHYAEVKATRRHWSTEKFTGLQVIMPDSFKLSRK